MIVSRPESSPCLIRPNSCEGPELCPMYPEIDCSWDLHYSIGFLYEQMRVTDSSWMANICGGCLEVPFTGCTLPAEFDMSYGVTTNLGYYSCWDDWYFDMHFDWLKATSCRELGADIDRGYIFFVNGMWVRNIVDIGADTCFSTTQCAVAACETMSGNYYMLQANLNRGSFVSLALALEPHAGIKTVWTEFFHHLTLSRVPLGEDDDIVFLHRVGHTKFWGIGPEWGLNMKWLLIEGISLFCDTDIAILFGHTVVHDNAFSRLNDCSDCAECNSGCRMEFCNSIRMMSPNLRTVLGFMYERNVCANTNNLAIKAGLDVNYYWNQFLSIDWIDNDGFPNFRANDHNDFSMVGLLFEVGYDF